MNSNTSVALGGPVGHAARLLVILLLLPGCTSPNTGAEASHGVDYVIDREIEVLYARAFLSVVVNETVPSIAPVRPFREPVSFDESMLKSHGIVQAENPRTHYLVADGAILINGALNFSLNGGETSVPMWSWAQESPGQLALDDLQVLIAPEGERSARLGFGPYSIATMTATMRTFGEEPATRSFDWTQPIRLWVIGNGTVERPVVDASFHLRVIFDGPVVVTPSSNALDAIEDGDLDRVVDRSPGDAAFVGVGGQMHAICTGRVLALMESCANPWFSWM